MLGRHKVETRTPEQIAADTAKYCDKLKQYELAAIKRARDYEKRLKEEK